MKVLVLGCGSIGRRHARNAHALGAEVVLCDVDEGRMHDFGEDIEASGYFTNFEEAAKHSGCEAAIVATPSNLHIESARALLSSGIHVLMEKPLCTSVTEAIELKPLVRDSGLVFMMAHTFRFRAEWVEMKRILDMNLLGRIYSAESMGGWYLPDWHIHEDYRFEYAGQKKLGGGVMLTGFSHMFDVATWLFGDIQKITGARMQLSDLEIDVDDAVICTLQTSRGIIVTMTEDFLSRCPRRTLRINAEHGYMEADFNRKTLRVWDARKKRFAPGDKKACTNERDCFKILEDGVMYDPNPEISPLQYSGNDAYSSELKYFFEMVESRRTSFDLDIDAGIKVLEAMHHAGIEDWTDCKEEK